MKRFFFFSLSLLSCLANATVVQRPAELNDDTGVESNDPWNSRTFPCPIDTDIAPCICTADDDVLELTMDCSAVTSDDDLQRAFAADIPIPHINYLIINGTTGINILNGTTFGTAYFSYVTITGTTLSIVEDGAFSKSEDFLIELNLSNNNILSFWFDLLAGYTVLETVNLSSNTITNARSITSDSLVTLDLSSNAGLQFDSNLFVNCPSLKNIYMRDSGISDIGLNLFSSLTALEAIDFSSNSIQTLPLDTINPPGDTLMSVVFDDNPLETVQIGFLRGMDPYGRISMANCLLEEIIEDAWEPQIAALGDQTVDLSGNPLRCGCDLEWLYEAASFFTKFTNTTVCSDGFPIYSIPSDIFPVHC